MPINIICPSCHARFKVSEKFAGQTGPCPKCKEPIEIPEADAEVKLEEPDNFGPKDASGRATLKPIEREETDASPVGIAIIVAICVVSVIAAFVLGRMSGEEKPILLLAVGALVLGPPLSVAGYGLLRDAELEPHRGSALWMRAIVCGLVYAALWGAYWYIKGTLFEGDIELFHMVFIGPVLVVGGAIAALAALELDFFSGAIHYGIYLVATCLLRWIAGVGVF